MKIFIRGVNCSNHDPQARIREGVNRGVGTVARTGVWAVEQGAGGMETVARTSAWAVEKGAEVRIINEHVRLAFFFFWSIVVRSRRSQSTYHIGLTALADIECLILS